MSLNIGWDTTTHRDAFKKVVTKVFDTTQEPALVQYPEMFKTKTVTDYFDRDARMAGLGLPSEIEDGEAIGTQDPVLDTTKEWTQARWGTGYRMTRGMKKFNRWDLANKLTKNLKINMLEGKDIDVSSIYNSATGTTITGFDGLALASNSHTCLDDASTTYDNYGDAALGVTSLKSARLYFTKLVKDDGQRLVIKPNKLWVNADLEYTAQEITRSNGEAYTADNTYNVHQGIKPFVYHRLTSTTSWGLSAKDHPMFDIKVFTAQEPQIFMLDTTDGSLDTLVLSEQWYQKGFGDPRCVYIGDL